MWIRNKDVPVLNDSVPVNVEVETVAATASEQPDNVEVDAEPVVNAEPGVNSEPSSSENTWIWKQENFDAPKSKFTLHC
jgi:hypothetical protein